MAQGAGRNADELECPVCTGGDQEGDAVQLVVDEAKVDLAAGQAAPDRPAVYVPRDARRPAAEGLDSDV